MEERTYQTRCGTIHYWASVSNPDATTLVFLPGLTADHRLFDKQIDYFEKRYNVIVWDAPAHGSSWPFRFDFDPVSYTHLDVYKRQVQQSMASQYENPIDVDRRSRA